MADSTTYSTAITPGAPPLRWDNVLAAFEQVNANFEILEAALGAAGITPINFSDLDSSIIPSDNGSFVLGDITRQWKSVFTAPYSEVPGNELNGLWAGNAQIKGVGYTVNLPVGSTIGGNPVTGVGAELIIDPDKNWFKTIQVDGGESIVATEVNDSFNILSGNGISLDVDSSAESLTVTNTGILNVTAGSGISRTIVSGTANIVNTGVLTLANTGSIGTRTSGLGIHVSSAAGNPVITNTGVLSLSAGIGITVSLDAVTGDVTVSNSAPAVNAFAQIEVDGDSANRLAADSVSDVLNITSGYAISLSKNVSTDTLTIAVDPTHDIKGSVFADDSTILVDAVAGVLRGNFIGSVFADDSTQLIDGNTATVYGNIEATTLRTSENRIVLGYLAGSIGGSGAAITIGPAAGVTNQGTGAMAIGPYAGHTNQGISGMAIGPYAGYTGQGLTTLAVGAYAGQTNQGNVALAIGAFAGNDGQGTNAVAIGPYAGGTNQGAGSIAIGLYAGSLNQSANSIVLNASGVALNGSAAGLYIDPIRSTTSAARPVVYNSTTKELFYTSTLEFINSTISTNDSSGLTVDVQTTFNTDVAFENDITVAERLTVKGSRVINLTELKSVVAASSSFADFQTRIAALV